jgi:hypothetical protein
MARVDVDLIWGHPRMKCLSLSLLWLPVLRQTTSGPFCYRMIDGIPHGKLFISGVLNEAHIEYSG